MDVRYLKKTRRQRPIRLERLVFVWTLLAEITKEILLCNSADERAIYGLVLIHKRPATHLGPLSKLDYSMKRRVMMSEK